MEPEGTMRQQTSSVRADDAGQRVGVMITRLVRGLSRRWLMLANVALGLSVGLPLLAPVLMEAGYQGLAEAIHTLYYLSCHQLPERSYFLFGPAVYYGRSELIALAGEGLPLRFVGNAQVGYKMAVCQRCAAIYAGWLLCGIGFGLVRDRIRPLALKKAPLLLVPIAVDGFGQLFGAWESTWLTRSITGLLFGLAVVWLTYPYIEEGMRDIRYEAEAQLAKGLK